MTAVPLQRDSTEPGDQRLSAGKRNDGLEAGAWPAGCRDFGGVFDAIIAAPRGTHSAHRWAPDHDSPTRGHPAAQFHTGRSPPGLVISSSRAVRSVEDPGVRASSAARRTLSATLGGPAVLFHISKKAAVTACNPAGNVNIPLDQYVNRFLRPTGTDHRGRSASQSSTPDPKWRPRAIPARTRTPQRLDADCLEAGRVGAAGQCMCRCGRDRRARQLWNPSGSREVNVADVCAGGADGVGLAWTGAAGGGISQGVPRLAAIFLSAESCSMSRIGRASAHTIASRMTVSSLSCRVSPDVDQLVDPEILHRPSTITILRCMIAPFSD